MKKERVFRMKKFSICHEVSANKVGVDGVLVGAWAEWDVTRGDDTRQESGEDMIRKPGYTATALDAGCGCGLIALMAAQRWGNLKIIGVDVESGAVEEAGRNVRQSPWSDRISIMLRDFREIKEEKFDLILSNPPFFNSGVKADMSNRMLARHISTLSPEILLQRGKEMLKEKGRLVFIAPADQEESLVKTGEASGLGLARLTRVKGNPRVKAKRILMDWRVSSDSQGENDNILMSELVIEIAPGEYSPEYRRLCRDFYLKFDC